jgi:hypothetical protein
MNCLTGFQKFDVGEGHIIAEVVSHQLLTAVAQVQSQLRSCGICGGQGGAGASFI